MRSEREKPVLGREKTLGEKIVQKLSYVVVVVIILVGAATISGVFFSEGGLSQYRVVLGVVILIYGLVRLWTLRLKHKRRRFEE